MTAAWARFAATGDPNGEGLPKWPAYDTATDQYMQFGDSVEVRSHLRRPASGRRIDLLD